MRFKVKTELIRRIYKYACLMASTLITARKGSSSMIIFSEYTDVHIINKMSVILHFNQKYFIEIKLILLKIRFQKHY